MFIYNSMHEQTSCMIFFMIPNVKDPAYLSALMFFDRAAQRLSFKAAANDLNVTPSAVSHRVAALEEALDKRLFIRETRNIRLTPEGIELAQATQQIFDDLSAVTKRLTERKVLRVSAGPYFSSSWLMQRLIRFERSLPGLRIDLIDAIGPVDMRTVDLSILWADSKHKPKGGRLLFETEYLPVTAASTDPEKPFWDSSILPLHYRDREPWRHWLRAVGAPLAYADRGEVLNDPNLVVEAATHARGIAIGIFPLVSPLIEQGRLKIAHSSVVPSEKSYWLLVADRHDQLSIKFEEWLLEEAEVTSR
jgi:LysR family glycine cleavage system transcriptional activator